MIFLNILFSFLDFVLKLQHMTYHAWYISLIVVQYKIWEHWLYRRCIHISRLAGQRARSGKPAVIFNILWWYNHVHQVDTAKLKLHFIMFVISGYRIDCGISSTPLDHWFSFHTLASLNTGHTRILTCKCGNSVLNIIMPRDYSYY